MVRDVMRFYREAPAVLEDDEDVTLGEYLERGRYSRAFVEQHMIPMGAAIWSARPDRMRSFPMRFLVRFFHNHGFLQVGDRPQWKVIRGGSREYVDPLVAPFRDRIRLETPVERVTRVPGGVLVRTAAGAEQVYDRVVLATHSDQSLRLLVDADASERELLSAFAYQRNEVLLHTDASLMPRARRAWSSWNYHVTNPPADLPTVTYWMNQLQSLSGDRQYFVTLNRNADVDPSKVLRSFVYHHPIYSLEAVRAQARHAQVDGSRGVHFCGAYWGYGFHEDGVKSGLAVAENIARACAQVPA
jgi:predicted NAD/FAD-binding protein